MSGEKGGGNIKWVVGAVLVPVLVACIGAGAFGIKDGCLPFFCGTAQNTTGDAGSGDNPGGGTGNDGGGDEFDQTAAADVFLSSTSGPGGSSVNVSGEGFKPKEQIVIRLHTEEVGRTQADGTGQFKNVAVTIPDSFSEFAPQKFDFVATGRESLKSARASFTISG